LSIRFIPNHASFSTLATEMLNKFVMEATPVQQILEA